MAAIKSVERIAHPKVDAGAALEFFKDAAVSLSIPGKNIWEGALYLESGAEGSAALFVQLNEHNTVQDRIVVKEEACTPEIWWSPLKWAGAYDPVHGNRDYSAHNDHSEASETYIHRKLSRRSPKGILEYRGRSRVYAHQWRWRLYTKFCAHGTLQSLLQYYQEMSNLPSAREFVWDGKASGLPDVLIPEPFIWYCALTLAKAAQVMERGFAQVALGEKRREVIHRDIKPGNVFLSEPSASPREEWSLYPAVNLADFGHSVETNDHDPSFNNPRTYRGISGTPGYLPPEQRIDWHLRGTRDHLDAPRLSANTNVYSIGMTLWALVYRYQPDLEQRFSGATDYYSRTELIEQLVHPGVHGIAGNGYSQALIDLVRDCINADPSDRPSPDELIGRIEANSALFESMRNVVPTPGEPWYSNSAGGEHILAGLKQDDYRLGLAREDLPSDSSVDSDSSDAGHGNL